MMFPHCSDVSRFHAFTFENRFLFFSRTGILEANAMDRVRMLRTNFQIPFSKSWEFSFNIPDRSRTRFQWCCVSSVRAVSRGL